MQGPGKNRPRPYTRQAWKGNVAHKTLRNRQALRRRKAAIERLAFFRHVVKELARLETLAAFLGESVAEIDKGFRSHAVDIGNGAAGERGKAEAEDRADVGFAHVGDDLLLDAPGGFERLDRQEPTLQNRNIDAVGIELGRLQIAKPRPQPFRRILRIVIKAFAVLASVASALLHHLLEQGLLPEIDHLRA